MDINLWAVLISAIIYMAIGAVWYSPTMFSQAWMKEIGKSEKELKANAKPALYLSTFLAELVAVYVLAWVMNQVAALNSVEGIKVAIVLWLGFAATTSLVNSGFAGRSTKLYLIDLFYHGVSLAVAGAIIGSWR